MRTILIALGMFAVACASPPARYADDGTGTVVRSVVLVPPLPCAPDTYGVQVETCSHEGCVTKVYELRGR
jgi:hypothetical protein